MIKIFQGGSTGLVQQNKRFIRKFTQKSGRGIQREIKDTLKGMYNFDIVIMQFGNMFKVIEEDAIFFKKEFNFKVAQPGRYTYEITGFPLHLKEKYSKRLLELNKSFCILAQFGKEPNFTREVIESTSEKALGITF